MAGKRLVYLDNLRVGLMVLVVFQHAVRAYGSSVWWFVSDARAPLLERFTAVNSSFFMSLFFFISFYFLPSSYDRKGFFGFHRDRFMRLFVPLIAYVSIVSLGMMYAYFRLARGYGAISFPSYYVHYFLGLGARPADWTGPAWPDANFGHLWFVEHLILYGIAYSAYRLVADRVTRRSARELPFPRFRTIALVALALALASFAIRARYPLYDWVGILGFIQAEPAHLPFYLAAFAFGVLAFRNDWLECLPGKAGKPWLVVGAVASLAVALFPQDSRVFGGLSALSFAYSLAETLACVGLVIGLPYLAWRRFNSGGPVLDLLAQNSYMMYILHLPIVVALQYLALPFPAAPYLKFVLVSALALSLTFIASLLVRKVPFFARYA